MSTMNSQRFPLARPSLVIGCGDSGRAILRAAQRRLAERWFETRGLAMLAVTTSAAGPDLCADVGEDLGSRPAPALLPEPVASVTLPDVPPAATRAEAQRALVTHRSLVESALVEALIRLAPLPARPPDPTDPLATPIEGARRRPSHSLAGHGHRLGQPAEIDVLIVGAAGEPSGGGLLPPLAALAQALIRQRRDADAVCRCLMVLPDELDWPAAEAARARAFATLCEIEQPWLAPIPVGRWRRGPATRAPFWHGCYLLGSHDAEGRELPDPSERQVLAAELLIQLLLAGSKAAMTPWVDDGLDGRGWTGYRALGAAGWVLPREAAAERAARQLVRATLDRWRATEPDAPAPPGAASDGPEVRQLHADELGQRLLPREVVAGSGVTELPRQMPSWSWPQELRSWLEEVTTERLECLTAGRAELDCAAARHGQHVVEALEHHLGLRLAGAMTGALAAAADTVRAWAEHLETIATDARDAADAHWETVRVLDDRLDELADAMARPAGVVAAWRGRSALERWLRPTSWPGAVLAQQHLDGHLGAYRALWARRAASASEVLRGDLTVGCHQQVRTGLEDLLARLTALQRVVDEAAGGVEEVANEVEAAEPAAFERVLMGVTSARRLGEWAIRAGHDTGAGIADGGGLLAQWLACPPSPETVLERCLAAARQQCAPITHVAIDELLAVEPEALEAALPGLVNAAVPFLSWDATRLTDAERTAIQWRWWLVVPSADSRLLRAFDAADSPPQVISAGDPTRITVVTEVAGLPRRALAGLDAYQAAYEAGTRSELHLWSNQEEDHAIQ
jgi:hypothetical protein